MGIKIVASFNNASLPYVYPDPVMSPGSLILVDLAHPASPAVSGVPGKGALLPNVAWKTASAMIGTGTESTLSVAVDIGSGFTSSVGVLERSGKGGLHAIMSPTVSTGTGKGMGIKPPQAVVDYLLANPDHRIYFSLWFKMTRFGDNTARTASWYMNSAPDSTKQTLFGVGTVAGGNLPGTSKRLGYRRTRNMWRPSDDSAVAAPFSDAIMTNIGIDGNTGTVNVSGPTALALATLFQVGSYPSAVGASGAGFNSKLLWRVYMEDLTVSGRSYGVVDTIDYDEYVKQCLTDGGRYYNDTYTEPAIP